MNCESRVEYISLKKMTNHQKKKGINECHWKYYDNTVYYNTVLVS